ncbi:MAG: CRISPR-associated helicase Cas3' [Verrucomicrobiae bacterium]|nr:CRISPR-associated helicase Cas3' [Verrucomicrobiae bacterium]
MGTLDSEGRMDYYAHTAQGPDGGPDKDRSRWQRLRDHLVNVARIARHFADPLGLADEAELVGLLHDLGKYRDEFQAYLRGERGSSVETQHAIYGAAWALEPHQQLGTMLCVAGHHAGIHDMADAQAAASKAWVTQAVCKLVARLESEVGPLPRPPGIPAFVESASEPTFAAEIYVRMLFSCLVDADRLDTAFWPAGPTPDVPLDAEILLGRVVCERDRKREANLDSPLGLLRNRIFDACLEAGCQTQGFFSLTVPTGGGKTLSGMAFALAHAKACGLRRVIVVIPYLSIIEQNAAEYRRILGDGVVLENHSNASPRPDTDEEEKDRLDLVSENWDAPVIVTTSVQFLESLFASSPSKCRKLHRIARSVVIFDEVQTLPTHLLKPMFSVFRELVRSYGVSFVFSSATQPAFRKSLALPDGFAPEELREIAPDPAELFRRLRRVTYHLPRQGEALDWPQLAARIAEQPQALCVVNLTRHAKELWEQVKRLLPDGECPIHLSSAMCPAHRLALIETIRGRLRGGMPCRVVSTQLIEAGVDVDFPVVWRAMGPLDSVVQVAGRCNREGRHAVGEVHVFRPGDHKLPPGVYRAASDQAVITMDQLGEPAAASERLSTDPNVFRGYFDSLYQVVNTDHARRGESTIQQDREQLRFREVSRKAKVIEDSGQPVIIAADNHGRKFAADLIADIRDRQPAHRQPRFTRDDLRALQRYMVNVHHHRFQQLESMKHLRPLLPNFELHVLADGFYHPDLGLLVENRPLDDFIA